MKKIMSIVLALVLVLGMSAAAFADTITVPATDDHTYEVYQIFTGDVSEGKLANIVWGANGTGTTGEAVDQTVLDALTAAKGNDGQKIDVVSQYVDLNGTPVATVTNVAAANVAPGYYLVKDVDGAADTMTTYIVSVVGDLEIARKISKTPTSEKKVCDDCYADCQGAWGDSADYGIGELVTFTLTATMPDDYAAYNKYTLTFHDQMSAGLTMYGNLIVYVDGDTENPLVNGTDYQIWKKTNGTLADGCSFEVEFKDLTKIASVHAGSTITVRYGAKVNDNAVIGEAGNPNTMHITYSNNPYNTEEKDKTPDDKVIVFTYEVVVNKVDGEGAPLTGAEFKLERLVDDEAGEARKTISATENANQYGANEAGTTFTFKGLDAGTYKLTETVTPTGYNTIDPIEFTITAEHDLLSDDPKLTTLTTDLGDVFVINLGTGTLTTNVVNVEGATLPTTGGMGTTALYVGGGLLVLAAFVLLITKKRMTVSDK